MIQNFGQFLEKLKEILKKLQKTQGSVAELTNFENIMKDNRGNLINKSEKPAIFFENLSYFSQFF